MRLAHNTKPISQGKKGDTHRQAAEIEAQCAASTTAGQCWRESIGKLCFSHGYGHVWSSLMPKATKAASFLFMPDNSGD